MTTENEKPRIAILDDEASIADVVARTLKRGYRVDRFVRPAQLFDALNSGNRYDTIICDVVMPGLSGRDVYEEIGERWPKTAERIIFMSGVGIDEIRDKLLKGVNNPVITKPFRLADLREAVDTMIEKEQRV